MKTSLAALALAASASVAGAGVIEVRTTTTRPTTLPPTWPPAANRLHISGFGAAPDVKAPMGTTVWIVADSSNNGIPAADFTGPRTVPLDMILGPDDFILKVDVVDGVAPGSFAGRYFSGPVNVPHSLEAANFFLLVWNTFGRNPASLDDVVGDGTMSFDFFDMGTATFPALGNAGVGVYEDMFADRMTVVPEPAACAAAGAGALLGFALLRRKSARCA